LAAGNSNTSFTFLEWCYTRAIIDEAHLRAALTQNLLKSTLFVEDPHLTVEEAKANLPTLRAIATAGTP
jgi:hypothetical protein